jgi:membrane protein required for colicin V production
LAIKVIEKLVNDIVSKVKLFQWLNRFLGIFLGLIEGMALITLLLFIIDVQPLLDNDQKERIVAGSIFANRIMPFIEKTKEHIPNTLKDVLPEPNTN